MAKKGVRSATFKVRDSAIDFHHAGANGGGVVLVEGLPPVVAKLFASNGAYLVSFGRRPGAVRASIKVHSGDVWFPAAWVGGTCAICQRLLSLMLPDAKPGMRHVYISARKVRGRQVVA